MNSACPRRVSLIIAGALPTIPSPTICVLTGTVPAADGFFFPSPQASSLAGRLAHARRPNRVHGGHPPGQPVLRTGRSRSVALHPASRRRSYGSIPHGSSPRRSGLPPLHAPTFSGALARRFMAGNNTSRILKSRQGRQILSFVPDGTCMVRLPHYAAINGWAIFRERIPAGLLS